MKTKHTPPQSLEKLQDLVILQLRAGAFDAASTVLQAYIQENPEEHWAQSELCRCLLRLNQHEQAAAQLHTMKLRQPDHPDVFAIEGLQAQLQGDTQRAIELYTQATTRDSTLLWAAYNLAQVSVQEQDEATAERWFDHVLQRDPEHFAARYQRALLYTRTGRAQESRDELVETINQNPLMLQPYLLLSELHLREGQGARSIEVLMHGLQANPLAHPLREALARTFSALGDGDAAFGVRLELCRVRGEFGDFLDLGLAALQKGMSENAAVAFTKAIQMEPKDWRGYYNLAELHRAANDYEGALPLYEKSIQFEPDAVAYNGFALWHLETTLPSAKPLDAVHYLQQALELSPYMPEAMYNLVLAYAKTEQYTEARQAFDVLQTKLPFDHRLHDHLEQLEVAIQSS